MVFCWNFIKKIPCRFKNKAGWGSFIENNSLQSIQNISLPTAWSFHESDETRYIFANHFEYSIQIKCQFQNVSGHVAQLG